jgi:hypothetical protein
VAFHFTARRLASSVVQALFLGFMVHGAGSMAEGAQTGTPEIPRVRSTDPTIRGLIDKASRLSATFRRLIDTIDTTDGIVYIEPGRCGRSVRACLALTVQVAGRNRILRIVVDPRKPDCDLITSIGHEFWHAIEVLREPSLTSDAALFFFYTREGRTTRTVESAWETHAAVKTGDAVRAELPKSCL